MPTNTSFSSGFGAGTRLGDVRVGQERNQLFREQQQQEQQTELRAQLDSGFESTIAQVQESAKKFSAAIESASDPTKRQNLIGAYDKYIEQINASEEEKDALAVNTKLISSSEAQSRASRLRLSAVLTDPVAETKLETDVKTQGAIATEAGEQPFALERIRETGRQAQITKGITSKQQIETTNITPSQEGASRLALAEERIVAENFDDSLSQVQDFVKSENYVGGIAGEGLQMINSAAQQFAQMTGTEELFNGTELNIKHLADDLSDENIGFLRRAAISGDVREAAKARLAYILAKQLDPNGRISNADVENAENILSGSADRRSTLLSLQNLRNTSEREFNTRARIMEQTLKNTADPFRPLGKTKGTGSRKDFSEMTEDELFQITN